jgi:orotate phosphoribosyltransferase
MLTNISNNNQEILEIFNSCQAILKGHFILSSGLHSDTYLQSARVLMYPHLAEKICQQLAYKISVGITLQSTSSQNIAVVSPAMGGVIVGFETAKHLNSVAMFCERVNGKFELRRGFSLQSNQQIIVIEDVITTGKSTLETISLIESYQAKVIAIGCLIDRRAIKSAQISSAPVFSLLKTDVLTFDNNNIPSYLQNTPAIKPGSRFLK